MGFDPQLFVTQPVDENLICDLCLEVLEKPTTACANGHVYCADCLERARERQPHCPGCRNDLLEPAPPNRPLSNLIMRQLVRCRNSTSEVDDEEQPPAQRRRTNENGDHSSEPRARQCCKWQETLDEYINNHKEACDYAPVTCTLPGCNGKFRRGELETHMAECPCRLVTCPECNASNIKNTNLQGHKDSHCPNVMSSCPHCHEQMLRREIGTCVGMFGPEHDASCTGHLAACPKLRLCCSFFNQGCTAVLPREDLAKHYAEKHKYHMLLLTRAQKEMEKKIYDANNWEELFMRWTIPTQQLAGNDQRTLKSFTLPTAAGHIYLKLCLRGQQVQVSLCTENPMFTQTVDRLKIIADIRDHTMDDSYEYAKLEIWEQTKFVDTDGVDRHICGPLKYKRLGARIDNDDEDNYSEYDYEEVEATRNTLLAAARDGNVVVTADFRLHKMNAVQVSCREVIVERGL